MGMTIKEWRAQTQKLSKEEAKEMAEAAKKLLSWKPFKDQYTWTGMPIIAAVLKDRAEAIV